MDVIHSLFPGWRPRGQLVAAASALLLSVLWAVLGSPTRILLYLVGTAASCVFGASAYVALRLYFSPRYSRTVFPPASALAMQAEIIEKMQSKTMPEEPTVPHITRNIDQSINDIIDLVSRDYVLHWVSHLMASDNNAKIIFKQDFWIFVNNLSERLSKVDMVKLLATDVMKKVADHFEKIRMVLSAKQQQHHSANGHHSEGHASDATRFPVSPHLTSTEREVEYLSKIAEVLVILLCKEDYGNCKPVRHLLKEVLARFVFLPAIDLVTDPDWVNTKILSYIKKHHSLRYLSRKSFVYADSYEDFVDLVNGSGDVEELKQIRYNVLTDIMQSTTMENLRKAKNKELVESEANVDENDAGAEALRSTEKAHTADVSKYISQLMHVKSLCEKRLVELGCDVSFAPGHVGDEEDVEAMAGGAKVKELERKISFQIAMNSPFARRYFSMFLDDEGQKNLLAFWVAVQDLKEADKTLWHHLGTEIFYAFINKTDIAVQMDKSSLKRIESFLLGDSGPEAFFELQGKVQEMLRETYFPSFVLSDHHAVMIKEAQLSGVQLFEDDRGDADSTDGGAGGGGIIVGGDDAESEGSGEAARPLSLSRKCSDDLFSGLSGAARAQLGHVTEKLQNKLQAMSALKSSLKPESRILSMLQQEVESLSEEKESVESHIHRTESWADNLGAWQCHVQSLEYSDDGHSSSGGGGDSSSLKAVMVVYIPEEGFRSDGARGGKSSAAAAAAAVAANASSPANRGTTWTCVRRIADFHGLHREMVPFVGWVKSLDLPSQSKSVFLRTPNSRAALEKGKGMLQRFMDRVLEDEQLSRSELLYSFLVCPHPGYLKSLQQPINSPRSNKSSFPSLPNFFKSESNAQLASQPLSLVNVSANGSGIPALGDEHASAAGGADDDNVRLLFDEFDATRVGQSAVVEGEKDATAEALYRLVGEVFDMRGVFRLLRKSLMTFVQITYGSTINRQIRDTVAWLTSEQMILYYLASFRKAYWHPNGVLREAAPAATDREGAQRRAALAVETREALVRDIPEVIVSLVGQQAAVSGTVKVFEALQNPTLNKQLLYDVLEMVMVDIFPEVFSTGGSIVPEG